MAMYSWISLVDETKTAVANNNSGTRDSPHTTPLTRTKSWWRKSILRRAFHK